MSALGHNGPPAHEAMALHIEELFTTISDTLDGAEVTSDEQEQALDALLEDARQARKDADAMRVAEKRPHDEAAKEVQSRWKPLLDRVDAASAEIKAKLTPYRAEKQRAKEEAIRKAREEAEAKERAAQEALRSENLEQRHAAETELAQAKAIRVQANKAERQATGLRTHQVVVVEDRRALLEHVMRADPDALTEWLTEYARKALPMQLPGVTIEHQQKAA